MLIAHWTCPNSLSYGLNVEVISSFCILVSIQLAVHVTKLRPVKCHFHPLCVWWGAEEGATLGRASSDQCLHASHCFSQRGGTSVWSGGCSPRLYLSVLWHDLISLGPGCCLESKLALHIWERRVRPRRRFCCSASCQPSLSSFRQVPAIGPADVDSSRGKANPTGFTFRDSWGRVC